MAIFCDDTGGGGVDHILDPDRGPICGGDIRDLASDEHDVPGTFQRMPDDVGRDLLELSGGWWETNAKLSP